jgi:hypothetical protein
MPPVPIVAVGRAEKRAMRCQAAARGFLVRRRVALWRAQNSATVRLQATARGLASRRKHFATLQAQRLERRVAQLEAALRSERRQRAVSEAFLRKLGEHAKALHAKATSAEAKADRATEAAGEASKAAEVAVAAAAAAAAAASAAVSATADPATAADHHSMSTAAAEADGVAAGAEEGGAAKGIELAHAELCKVQAERLALEKALDACKLEVGDALQPEEQADTPPEAQDRDDSAAAQLLPGTSEAEAVVVVQPAGETTTVAAETVEPMATATVTSVERGAEAAAPEKTAQPAGRTGQPTVGARHLTTAAEKLAADKARRAAAREAFIAARAAKAAKISAEARERAARDRAARTQRAGEPDGRSVPKAEEAAASRMQAAWRAHSPQVAMGRARAAAVQSEDDGHTNGPADELGMGHEHGAPLNDLFSPTVTRL